jgi:hypothetical protein
MKQRSLVWIPLPFLIRTCKKKKVLFIYLFIFNNSSLSYGKKGPNLNEEDEDQVEGVLAFDRSKNNESQLNFDIFAFDAHLEKY